jgi:hypothetical protein
LISKSKLNKIWWIGNESQSSSLILCDNCSAQIGSGRYWSKFFNENNEYELGNNSDVDIEVDCEKRTTYFFINKKQCPYYISDIYISSIPLLFGFSSYFFPVVEVISLFKILPSSSYVNCSVQSEPVKWVSFIQFIILLLFKFYFYFF